MTTHLGLFLPLGILWSFWHSAWSPFATQFEHGCLVSHLSFLALHREHEGVSFFGSISGADVDAVVLFAIGAGLDGGEGDGEGDEDDCAMMGGV